MNHVHNYQYIRQIAVVIIGFIVGCIIVFLVQTCRADEPNAPPAWFQDIARNWLKPIGSVQVEEPNGTGRIITCRINLEDLVQIMIRERKNVAWPG